MKTENEFREAARAVIEEATCLANDAGVFCDACVKKIDTGYRPVGFCSTCHSTYMLWLASIIERDIAEMATQNPGRFTIWKVGGETYVRRNW